MSHLHQTAFLSISFLETLRHRRSVKHICNVRGASHCTSLLSISLYRWTDENSNVIQMTSSAFIQSCFKVGGEGLHNADVESKDYYCSRIYMDNWNRNNSNRVDNRASETFIQSFSFFVLQCNLCSLALANRRLNIINFSGLELKN